jgi:adenosylhomocysteine nucleosidase
MGIAEAANADWLVVAAEAREFDGILKRCGICKPLRWDVEFACEIDWRGKRWILLANGPGPQLVEQALMKKIDVSGLISTGFCGALDPALKIGDVVTDAAAVLSIDRVAVTALEKRELREKTGARVIEMESAAVAKKAAEWGVKYRCIRAVSDVAGEDMPLDFNLFRNSDGRFSRMRIAMAALRRPFTVLPALLRLDRNSKIAAHALGDFFADNRL